MKKEQMTRASQQLKTVIDFLNGSPMKPTVVLRQAPGGTPSPEALLRQSAAQQVLRKRAEESHRLLRFELTSILAPHLLVPRNWKPEARDKQTKFFNRMAPGAGLVWLMEMLNAQAIKPTWKLERTTRRLAKIIDLAGFTGVIVKEEFTHPTWQAVANLLETGDILKIGQCAICQTFFLKNRDWQKACNKKDCRRKYENQLSADRKARARAMMRRKK